jgi:hypothetical protein
VADATDPKVVLILLSRYRGELQKYRVEHQLEDGRKARSLVVLDRQMVSVFVIFVYSSRAH